MICDECGLDKEELNNYKHSNTILFGYRGSIVHGMYVPSSNPNSVDDVDIICVYIGAMEHYLGFGRKDHYEKMEGVYDVIGYEISKFIGLLCKGNPNVLSMLWMPKDKFIDIHPLGQKLLDNRPLFLSKRFYDVFKGYSFSQKQRMTRISGEGDIGEKRKALVQRYGYDTKNAAHTVRLLRMGIEFLTTGVLRVDRTNVDNEELLDIKLGGSTLHGVTLIIDSLFKGLDMAYECSPLPEKVDTKKVEKLLMDIISEYHGFNC